jgi:hypothetical protein
MYYFTRLSHIVDGFILPAGMQEWVVCTRTRTRLPDGYMMLPIYVPAGRNIIPYSSPYRVKPVGYSGFGYPLPTPGAASSMPQWHSPPFICPGTPPTPLGGCLRNVVLCIVTILLAATSASLPFRLRAHSVYGTYSNNDQ